jgi:hypothetical protein
MTDAEVFALIVRHRIALDVGTRYEDGKASPIWIARRNAESVSRESVTEAVLALAQRQGLLPRAVATCAPEGITNAFQQEMNRLLSADCKGRP